MTDDLHRVPFCTRWILIRNRRAVAGTPIGWITRACVALASQRDAAAVAQDGAAEPAVTHAVAADAGAAAEPGAQPFARRAAPADARPGVAQVVRAVRSAVSAHARLALRRAVPERDG